MSESPLLLTLPWAPYPFTEVLPASMLNSLIGLKALCALSRPVPSHPFLHSFLPCANSGSLSLSPLSRPQFKCLFSENSLHPFTSGCAQGLRPVLRPSDAVSDANVFTYSIGGHLYPLPHGLSSQGQFLAPLPSLFLVLQPQDSPPCSSSV